MNILILGGAGFLGSNLARTCLHSGSNSVTVVDSLDPKLQSSLDNLADVSGEIEFIQGDIRDAEAVRQMVTGRDVIFNCAAQTSHPISMAEPVFDAGINCIGNLNVLEDAPGSYANQPAE